MRDVREFIEKGDWGYFDGGYDKIVESLGFEVVKQVNSGEYQGDTGVFLRDGVRLGLLIYSWGSCSGCDAYEAATSYEDLEEIQTGFAAGIKWFDTREALIAYVDSQIVEDAYNQEFWRKLKAEVPNAS